MDRLFGAILRRKKAVILIFAALTVLSCFLWTGVRVNYTLADYLPDDAESTIGLERMRTEFPGALPNARVLLRGVSVTDALEIKEQISAIDGVEDVLWLDDVLDLRVPLETADAATVETYYKDGNACLSVAIATGHERGAVDAIRGLVGDAGAISGDAVHTAVTQELAAAETLKAAAFLIPLILLLLALTTRSWLEPLLFLISIGVSIVINMGLNIFFGEISFMTSSVAPLLQLAVSLDYAIFLLAAFREERERTPSLERAMKLAMKRAFPAVSASALTTIFGFLALVFMRFGIGADLGVNLAKGVTLSLVSVMVFLPALTLACAKLLDRTSHRSFLPRFDGAARGLMKCRIPALLLVLLLVVPAYLAQMNNTFTYGMGELEPASVAGRDEAAVTEAFGRSVATVVLVPRGDVAREAILSEKLADIDHVTAVVSYAHTVGAAIPPDFVGDDALSQFYSKDYARILLYADTPADGDLAFSVVEAVRGSVREVYPEGAYTFGESANLYDMRDVVTSDAVRVNWIAIAAIALVLLVTFRSISLPVLLVLTIETSIWMNLSVTYLSGSVLCYIGYLIISTVQLGATVDYAILYTDHYRAARDELPKLKAATQSLAETLQSILTSAAILASAGFIIRAVSTNEVVSQLGALLGRGTVLSALMVFLVLPGY